MKIALIIGGCLLFSFALAVFIGKFIKAGRGEE